jgi:hypothetical protein
MSKVTLKETSAVINVIIKIKVNDPSTPEVTSGEGNRKHLAMFCYICLQHLMRGGKLHQIVVQIGL